MVSGPNPTAEDLQEDPASELDGWTCPVCGSWNQKDFAYCTQCAAAREDELGEDGHGLGDDEPSQPPLRPDDVSELSDKTGTKRGKAPLVIGCVIACVAVLAVALVVGTGGDVLGAWRALTEGSDTVAASYASDEVVEVSADTDIIPMDASGEPLKSYVVRVKQADDLDGAAIDPTSLPNLAVDGSGGFSLSDFGNVESGTYYLSVTDATDNSYDLPPVRVNGGVDDQDDLPATLEVSASSEGNLFKQGKYASFLGVLDGLVEAYGDAALGVLKLNDNQYLSWVAGVSYAGLVDFGDGTEYLVVMYCTDDDLSQSDVIEVEGEVNAVSFEPKTDSYQIEVWKYDSDQDSAVMVCQLEPTEGDDGSICLSFLTNPSTGYTCLYADGLSKGQCYGIGDGGLFGIVASSSTDFSRWTVEESYLVSHYGTTQDAALDDSGTSELSCVSTAQTVKDLRAKLKTICGG